MAGPGLSKSSSLPAGDGIYIMTTGRWLSYPPKVRTKWSRLAVIITCFMYIHNCQLVLFFLSVLANSVATACYTPSNILNFSYMNTPAIHYFHIDHNAPCLPPKFWVLQSREKSKIMVMENLWGTQGAICLCENGGWGVSCGKLAVQQKRIVLVRLTLLMSCLLPITWKIYSQTSIGIQTQQFQEFLDRGKTCNDTFICNFFTQQTFHSINMNFLLTISNIILTIKFNKILFKRKFILWRSVLRVIIFQDIPWKGVSANLGFWIPHRGFRMPGTGFQFLSVELGILHFSP